MLLSELNECRDLMDEVSQNKQEDNEHKNIVKKNNTFFSLCENNLFPIIRGYIICKKYKHATFSDKMDEDFKKIIDYAKITFEQKRVKDIKDYLDKVNKFSNKVKSEWKEQTDEKLFEIKEELGILKLVSNEKQEIQRILLNLNNFSNLPDEKSMREYELAKESAEEILSRMEFDDEIANFLRKVKDREASLLDLTDPIIDWIRKENLSGNIKLSIKN